MIKLIVPLFTLFVALPTIANSDIPKPQGWWQLQSTNTYADVCSGNASKSVCTPPPGNYVLIDYGFQPAKRTTISISNNASAPPRDECPAAWAELIEAMKSDSLVEYIGDSRNTCAIGIASGFERELLTELHVFSIATPNGPRLSPHYGKYARHHLRWEHLNEFGDRYSETAPLSQSQAESCAVLMKCTEFSN